MVAYTRSLDRRRMIEIAPHQYVALRVARRLGLVAKAPRRRSR